MHYLLLSHHNVDPKNVNATIKTKTIIQAWSCFLSAVKAGFNDQSPTADPSGELATEQYTVCVLSRTKAIVVPDVACTTQPAWWVPSMTVLPGTQVKKWRWGSFQGHARISSSYITVIRRTVEILLRERIKQKNLRTPCAAHWYFIVIPYFWSMTIILWPFTLNKHYSFILDVKCDEKS